MNIVREPVVLGDLATWVTAFSTVALVIATAAQVYVTKFVGDQVKKASETREKQASSRYVNEQWQNLNIRVASNEELLNTVLNVYESESERVRARKRSIVFYILNILYDLYNAEGDYIDCEFRNYMTRDHVRILLKTSKEDVNEILTKNRGYTVGFRNHIECYIKSIEAEADSV